MPVPCNPLANPACVTSTVVHSATTSIGSGILDAIGQAVTAGIRWAVVNTSTWWIQVPSPSLAGEPAVTRIQQWLLPIAAAVAVGGVIAAGLRMALTRRGNPLLDLGGGLITIAAVTTIGASAAALLVRAGDAWSAWVLNASTGGQFTARMVQLLDLGGQAAPFVVLVFGVIAIFFALAQAVLMLFRQAALIVLAGALPLAAAGSIAPLTRPWIRKVTAWMLALICYKPAAAAVFATAFTLVGTSRGPAGALMGVAMLVLSVFTLPALMKLFTWTVGTVGGSSGGGQLMSAAAMGAVAVGAMRSQSGGGAGAAQDQAAFMSSRLGPGTPAAGATSPGPGSAAASQAGPAPATATTPSMSNGPAPASPAPPAGAASAGGGASGAAAAAGPAAAGTAAADAAARAAARAARQATDAMNPGDQW
jgi:hypothetical protein